MPYQKIITIEPGKRSGKPCIRGTRMTVTDVLEYLAGGMTPEHLLAEFPDLTREDRLSRICGRSGTQTSYLARMNSVFDQSGEK